MLMMKEKSDEELMKAAKSLEAVMHAKIAAKEDPSSVADAFGVYMKELERRHAAAAPKYETPRKPLPSSVGSFVRHISQSSTVASVSSDKTSSKLQLDYDVDIKTEPGALRHTDSKRPFLTRSARKHCRM
jgi:hypothetical protein